MKVLINDYAGHPFQYELSEEFSRRGHQVWHCYSADVEGAKAGFETDGEEKPVVKAVTIGHSVRKYQFHKRLFDERAYGQKVASIISEVSPDVVVNANMPLDAFKIIRKAELDVGAKKIYWLQDMIGHAVDRLLKTKYFGLGALLGKRFLALESFLLKGSDHIIEISEGFTPYVEAHGVQSGNISVIHNWAPLQNIPQKEKDNFWKRQCMPDVEFCYLYSGTLGLKHNPEMLLNLARELETQNINAKILVVSEGIGADYISKAIEEEMLTSIFVLPYQSFEVLPEVLGSGDVLLTLLEADAGVFSVPSKILSYMCAGRPQLAAMPRDNLGAKLISDINCGEVVDPGDSEGFTKYALALYERSASDLANLGRNARNFAESNFNIEEIANKFEKVF